MTKVKISRWRAARNLAKLYSGQASQVEARKANGWLYGDEQYRAEYESTSHLLANMEGLAGDPDMAAWKDEPVNIGLLDRAQSHWKGVAAAASIVLASLVGLNIYWGESAQGDASNVLRYVTRIGEQKTVELADGSVITMNTGSLMLVDLGEDRRRITLERGEAYFDVARDEVRPFTVNLGVRSVTVLGTEFNILRLPNQFTLAVTEGEVAIHQPEESQFADAQLIANDLQQQINIDSSAQYRVKAGWVVEYISTSGVLTGYAPDDMNDYQSWRTGMITVENKSLLKVVKELNRYSAKKILIEDADIGDLKMYGVLKVDSISNTLASLERTLPIKITHHFDKIVVTAAE